MVRAGAELRVLATGVALLCAGISGAALAAEPTRVETIAVLHKAEPYAPLLQYEGAVWTGHNRGKDGLEYVLEKYSGDRMAPVALARLKHTVTYIYPFGPGKLIVVGKSYVDEWETHYTVVTQEKNGLLSTKPYTFSTKWMVDEFGGDPDNMYFNEPGSRALLKMGRWGVSQLPIEISGPGQMVLVGKSLFILERKGMSFGDENIVKFDTEKKAGVRTFDKKPMGIATLLPIDGGKQIAIAEILEGKISFLDTETNKIVQSIEVPAGSPRALATWGQCLVVGTDDPQKKVVSYFNLKSKDRALVVEREFTDTREEFKSIYSLAVEQTTGRIFAKSKAPCVFCEKSENVFVLAEPPTAATRKACGLK